MSKLVDFWKSKMPRTRLAEKMQYMTTAARLRGYAEALDEYEQRTLIHTLNKAASLLEKVWEEYETEQSKEEAK